MSAQGAANEVGWPGAGDSLLAGGDDWQTVAALPPSDFLGYATSFKEAADIVVETVERTGRRADSVVYAVFFLYRHYLELMLKGLIRLGKKLQGGSGCPQHHQIDRLWGELRPMLEKEFPEGERSATEAVERCIKELSSMDPGGEAFRYPERKDGQATIQGVSCFSLRNVRKTIDDIDGFLGGSYDALFELYQLEADAESELDSP